MKDLLQEYKDYYRARYERAAKKSRYPNSTETERKLFEAMDSCQELMEFKDKLGNLNELNAVALVKDQETIRAEEYTKLQEHVRALGPQRIVAQTANMTTAQEAITVSVEEGNKNSIEISMDESVRVFNDWHQLEQIEIAKKAQIPDRWKADYAQTVQELEQSVRQGYRDLEENNQPWQAGWKINLDLIWEHRHRRLLPFSDATVQKRINETKAIIGH